MKINCTTEMASHLRRLISKAGIKAFVRRGAGSLALSIHIFPTTYEARFTPEEQKTILTIAKDNGLTLVMGQEIDPDFAIHGAGVSVFLTDEGVARWRTQTIKWETWKGRVAA